jgi:hypothetical protein
VAITAGNYHTCAILDDHTVKCWGHNLYGQLGIGTTDSRGNDPDELGDAWDSIDVPGKKNLTDGGAATVFESDPVERVVPEVGKLVLFAPTTWHRTEPHTDAAPRVTIAFDALP